MALALWKDEKHTFIESFKTALKKKKKSWFGDAFLCPHWLHTKRLLHGRTVHFKSTVELCQQLKASEIKEHPFLWSTNATRLRLHNIREVYECSGAFSLMEKATTDHLDKSIFAVCCDISHDLWISLRILAVRASDYHCSQVPRQRQCVLFNMLLKS